MNQFYSLIDASTATVPHFAVVLGAQSVDPGETVFSVESGERPLFVEVALERIVELANLRETPMLDELCFAEVLDSDLVFIAKSLAEGRSPALAPVKFGCNDLSVVRKRLFNGTGPGSLSEFAASMAIKDLEANWRDALSEGSSIGDLTADVDDVIAHLVEFKRLCTDRVPSYEVSEFTSFIAERRERTAEAILDAYDFKFSVTELESCWRLDGADRMMKKGRGEVGGLACRFVLHVVFAPNSFRAEESYVLDLDTGSML